MATQSPLRGKSGENRSYYHGATADSTFKRSEYLPRGERVEIIHDGGPNIQRVNVGGSSFTAGGMGYSAAGGMERVHIVERENLAPESGRYRSRSPVNYAATRQYQYQSRLGVPPPLHHIGSSAVKQVTVVRSKVDQHHEFFVAELQADISELRNRQRDFGALQEQFRYLQEQYKQVQLEKQKIESDSLIKIQEDRAEVDKLIVELDGLKQANYAAEDEQMKTIEQISVIERDVAVASGELAGLRQQSSVDDQVNLNLRKEISYQEGLVTEQKECSHDAYKELTAQRETGLGLDKELDTQHKRVSILRTEIDNNDQRIANIQDLLMSKEEAIAKTSMKISETHQIIQEQKYGLNKLDGELGYFESQNEQHKNAQSQLFKANEYEYVQSKDNQLKSSELEVTLNKLDQDEKSVAYEIDRLKQHSEQMMRDQIDLQAEVDALDKHMANLNNQNYCLQKELEGFIQADEQVRQGLDRKTQVDHIRNKVDDVIRRSQQEVEQRINVHKQEVQKQAMYRQEAAANEARAAAERSNMKRHLESEAIASRVAMSRSANHYSPSRVVHVQERVPYRPANEVVHIVQRSTSSGAAGSSAHAGVRTTSAYSPSRQSRYGMGGGSFQYAETRPVQRQYSPLRKDLDGGKKVSFQDGQNKDGK